MHGRRGRSNRALNGFVQTLSEDSHHVEVINSMGSGLWPFSNRSRPKHFQNLNGVPSRSTGFRLATDCKWQTSTETRKRTSFWPTRKQFSGTRIRAGAKHVIARDLTERDNVCVTARDVDGDGKCEIAVGGQWNFRESNKDGAVFYLDPGEDRTEMWTPIKLYNDPSTHRMHWVKVRGGDFRLVVKPLRGRGSVNGDGAGLRLLAYAPPADRSSNWTYHVISDFMHLSHNFHPVNWDDDPEEEIIVAGKEGVWHFDQREDRWAATQLTDNFAGEIRDGRLPNGKRFIVTIEPMHGSKSAVYEEPEKQGDRWVLKKVLDESLKDGHALAVADYLGIGSDQIVVGWRAMNDPRRTRHQVFRTSERGRDAMESRTDLSRASCRRRHQSRRSK